MQADFGRTADGRAVAAVTIGAGRLTARLLAWGAVLQSVRLEGVAHDLTLGSDRLADYEGEMRHHGSVIGPVVNRLSGAAAVIDGDHFRFEPNQDGRITLHAGAAGTHLKLWKIVAADATSVALAVTMPDGEGGFPGNRRLTARFEALPPATLRLVLTATTDAPTLMNVANHSYWNLDGSPTYAGHTLRLAADRYLPTRPDFTPQGPVLPVEGTAMDLRQGVRLQAGVPAFDTCFCLADTPRDLTEVLWLTGASGVGMAVATTAPGLQVYDARDARRPGGGPHEGLAIEAQLWPDAPANPAYPSIMLGPGQVWEQVTEWRFTAPG